MVKAKQKSLFILILIMLLKTNVLYALPFTIVPKVPLPTQVILGGTAFAFYTVTNNTNSLLADNYVKYLPQNVTQVTSDVSVPDLCGAKFTLAPHGQLNDSCTLELKITGPVTSAGCDIHLHLLICLKEGLACAGTPNPLDVVGVTIIEPLIAVGNYSLGSIPFRKRGDGAQPALIANTNVPTSWIYLTPSNPPGVIQSSDLFSVSCAGSLCVTVGRYDIGNGFQPALIVSQNKGMSWSYVIPNQLPGAITNSSLSSVTCIDSHCAAVGNYDLGAGTQMALVTSIDGGASWQLQAPANAPVTTVAANLNTVRCPGNQCITVGQYDDGSGFKPAVIISQDMGVTWQLIDPVIGMPALTSIAISTVDCTGNTCAAAGQLNDGSETMPTIIVSNEGGPWHYITPNNQPGTIRSTTLRDVRCVGNTCVAVGQYTNAIGGPQQPAIIASTDRAQNWSFITPNNTPGSFTDAILTSADCSQSLCAAVGQYNIGADTQPAIVVSRNAGADWQFVATGNSPGTIVNAALNSVLCQGRLCIAVGNYDIGAGTQPALIRSIDSGNSWQFIFPKNPAGTIVSANLYSVECKNNLCTAVGFYDLGEGSQPLIIVSGDDGTTWQYVTPSNPPGKIISGLLHSVSLLP